MPTELSVHRSLYPLIIRDCLAGVALGLASIMLFKVPEQLPRVWMSWLAACILFPAAIPCALMSIVILLTAAHDCFLVVEMNKLGLVWNRLGSTSLLHWEEIKSVYNNGNHAHHGGRNSRLFFGYSVMLDDGRRFRFGPYISHAEELGIAIEQEATRHLLPKAQKAYYSGEDLDFGGIQLSLRGWNKKSSLVAWDRVTKIYIDERAWFTIETRSMPTTLWIVISLNKVCNLHLLLALLSQIGMAPATPLSPHKGDIVS
jgi:hypothetical protein